MDELIFRGTQTFESLQVQSRVLFQQTQTTVKTYAENLVNLIIELINSPQGVHFRSLIHEFFAVSKENLKGLQHSLARFLASPKETITNFILFVKYECSKQHVNRICAGFLIGAVIGYYVGQQIQKPPLILRHMKAIVCAGYNGTDALGLIDEVVIPTITHDDDVLVQVKTATIDNIDYHICWGYGKYIRSSLARYFQKRPLFPIILGRSCAGIVTEVGCKVTVVEVGDEVWVSSPAWCSGTLTEVILTKEYFLSRKPAKLSFEAAASLAYSGCAALKYLQQIGLVNSPTAQNKHVLVENCCTPIGCVITQILKCWGCEITTSSVARAVPVAKAMGSMDNIILTGLKHDAQLLINELKLRNASFDYIFVTKNDEELDYRELQHFLKKGYSRLVRAYPQTFKSDNYGAMLGGILSIYLRLQYHLQRILFGPSFEEQNLLRQLTSLIEHGHLQSVVDHIYSPTDYEVALNHKMSAEAIGNTIIKF